MLGLGGMIVLAGVIVVAAGSFCAILIGLRKAPEGYEDGQGFHLIRKRASGAAVVRSSKYARAHGSGSLKRAEAHL